MLLLTNNLDNWLTVVGIFSNISSLITSVIREDEVTPNFSDFLRKSLLLSDGQKQMEKWFNLWKNQKLEQISRDVHEILIIAKINHQVTQEHVSILLTCIQELIKEVEKTSPLSEDFSNKYMRW